MSNKPKDTTTPGTSPAGRHDKRSSRTEPDKAKNPRGPDELKIRKEKKVGYNPYDHSSDDAND